VRIILESFPVRLLLTCSTKQDMMDTELSVHPRDFPLVSVLCDFIAGSDNMFWSMGSVGT